MSNPFVSVVTPVYNGEKYLDECIASVRHQSFENWEYIVVNNCSEDRSLEIARQHAAEDTRIRVVDNTEFLSAIDNINYSLSLISPSSKYCKALMADDWLFPNCIADMVELAEKHQNVGIVGSYRIRDTRVMPSDISTATQVIDGAAAARMNLLDGPYTLGSPTVHLFRADIVRGRTPFYKDQHLAIDVETCLTILREHDFGFVHQIGVFQRTHPDTLTSKNEWYLPQYLNGLYMLETQGPYFLSDRELTSRRNRLLRSYYRALGDKLLTPNKPPGFVDSQRQGLARSNHELSWRRVILAMCRQSIRRILRRR